MSIVAGFIAVCLGFLVIIGWSYNSTLLTSIMPHWASMKPITALMFLLMGGAVVLGHSRFLTVAIALMLLTFIIASITSVSAVLSPPGASNPLLEQTIARVFVRPFTPSLGTLLAFSLAAFACTVGALGNGKLRPVRRACAFIVAGIGVTALIGYAVAEPGLYWYFPTISEGISVYTGLGFIALGTGIHEFEAPRP